MLVEEEMRRTIAYGYWSSCEWLERAGQRAGRVDGPLEEGLRAYAQEQSSREVTTCERLESNWAGIREKGRAYLARETTLGVEVRVSLDDDERAGADDEEQAPDYEDEDDEAALE